MRIGLIGIVQLLTAIALVGHAQGDWYFVAPKGHPIYQGDGSDTPQMKPLQELADFVGEELSIELLTTWFGKPKMIHEGSVRTPDGFLFSRLLYRAPQFGAIGPKEVYEQYVYDVDATAKLYFIRSRWHDDATWRSMGYFAAKWTGQTSYHDASDEERDDWEKTMAKNILASLRAKKAESGPRD